MLDTKLTVSLPLQVKVDLRGLDFNRLVQAIGKAAAATYSELPAWMVRAAERRAMGAQPDRWINRGQLTRRVQGSWGTVPVRRTRVRDRITGATCNLGDRLLHWHPYALPDGQRPQEAKPILRTQETTRTHRAASDPPRLGYTTPRYGAS
jgi:hypothetical protein